MAGREAHVRERVAERVPSIVEPDFIEIRRCTADFALLIEKGTQWNRLSEDKFWRRYNCVLLTGKGQLPHNASGAKMYPAQT